MEKVGFTIFSVKSTHILANDKVTTIQMRRFARKSTEIFNFQLTVYNLLMKKSTTPTKPGSSVPIGKKPFDAN